MWSNRAWQSRLWCLMGPAQHPKQYFCLTAGYWPQEQTCHGAYEEAEEQAQGTAATCAAHHPAPQHIWAREQPQPSANTTTALAKKSRFWFLNLSRGQNPAWGKGMGRGSFKKHQEPEWHRPEEMHSTDYPGLLSTPNSGEGHLFLPIIKLLWICKRGEEPALWSLIAMQKCKPYFSQQED